VRGRPKAGAGAVHVPKANGAVVYLGQGRDHAVRIGQHNEDWMGAVDPAKTAVFRIHDRETARRWEDILIKFLAPLANRARGIGISALRHQHTTTFTWEMHRLEADARCALRSYLDVGGVGDGEGAEELCRHVAGRLARADATVGAVGCGDAGVSRFVHHPYHPAFKLRYPVRQQYLMRHRGRLRRDGAQHASSWAAKI
jgi:hypothetical protein